MRTEAQRRGDAAEELVAHRLREQGWRILARQVRVGRAEIDIVAVDPGPPGRLVVVEVRWRGGRGFGQVEETVDWRKRRQLTLASQRLLAQGLPDGSTLPRLGLRLDLVVVEPALRGIGPPRVRHHRNAIAG
jgi:putative endonuclease